MTAQPTTPPPVRTSRKSLLRSALEIILGRASVSILSLAFLAYFARVLPKPVLGVIGIHAALVMLIKILGDLGLHFQVIREATPLLDEGRDDEALHDVIAPATLIRVSAALLLTATLAALGYTFLDVLQEAVPGMDMRVAVPFACAHALFKTVQYILTPIFFVQGRFGLDSVLDSASATAEKLFAFLLFLAGGADYFFVGLMVGELLLLLVAAWFLRDVVCRFRPRHLSVTDACTRLKAYFPHYQRIFYRRGLRQVDRLVIAALLPLEQMANYHVARQSVQPLRFVVRVLADPLMVRLAADPDLEHHQHDRRIYYAAVILVPLLLALMSPWLIQVIGGAAYAGAWGLMAALALSYIFYGLSEYQLAVIAMLGGDEPVGRDALAGFVGIAATVGMIAWIGEAGAPSGQLASFMLLYLGGRLATGRLLARRGGSVNSTGRDPK